MAAALMDGASPLRTLWSIILPMSRPILGVVSIFAVTAVWKDFLWPKLVMPSPETRTVSVGIYAFSGGTPMNVVIAALGHRRDPDRRHLPDLPAEHHVRSDRGQPQGIATTALPRGERRPFARHISRSGEPADVLTQKAGARVHS